MKKTKKSHKIFKLKKSNKFFSKKFLIPTVIAFAIVGALTLKFSHASTIYSKRMSIIAKAESQLGVKEGSLKLNAYTEGHPDEDWCADFVSWVYWKAGYPFKINGWWTAGWRIRRVYLPDEVNLRDVFIWSGAYRTKETGYIPSAGDVIIFARNGRSHTGFVKTTGYSSIWKTNMVYTIEGNTDTNNVAERAYSINDATIDGYGIVK